MKNNACLKRLMHCPGTDVNIMVNKRYLRPRGEQVQGTWSKKEILTSIILVTSRSHKKKTC